MFVKEEEFMKQNGNDQIRGEYYLGLDVGTNSVGWAVTDQNYQLLKYKGNAMWGARLFEEAQDASARRTNRVNRRRIARRKQRLLLLEMLFAGEIAKTDPNFFVRMAESAYWCDDKTDKLCRFSLFNEPGFTDKDYHKKYPTVYHLRKELCESQKPHDVRLVYLALHHLIKSRGHFLYEAGDSGTDIHTVSDTMSELREYLETEYSQSLEMQDEAGFMSALLQNGIGITAKKRLLRAAWGHMDGEDDAISLSALFDLFAGAKVKLAALFLDETLANAEPSSLSLKGDLDNQFDVLAEQLGDRAELLVLAKNVYDAARLTQMLDGHKTISEAKIALYEKNRRDLRILKQYVRTVAADKYNEIFSAKSEKLNNYAAYSGYRTRSGDHTCTQEDFCKYLKNVLPTPDADDETMKRIFAEIDECSFLTKLRGTDNGVIPYQLQRQELRRILTSASTYLPFLNERDEDGHTVREKVEMIFEFRIPYYVGPIKRNAGYWAVRFPGKEQTKVFPWNFTSVIDTEASSSAFIVNLIGRCTYTGEQVLPKDSLLYSEYMLLNELNPLRVNGKPLPLAVRQTLIHDLFMESRKRVTKKQIRNYLLCQGYIQAEDEITGIDDSIKTVLKSFHDFRRILDKTGDRNMVEEIIRHLLIFGEDRRMLINWMNKNCRSLDEADIRYISKLKYAEWGRLSKTFLTGIFSADPDEGTGEAHSIMDMLRSTDCNLMQLLSDKYEFAKNADAHRLELFGNGQTLTERLNELYIAPAVRRSIRQTLRIVDEIIDIRKSVPEKVFIEMARGSAQEVKGKRTESRKSKLLALYAMCREESAALQTQLENETDDRLRSDKLYLYYTQFGKCMYSGEPIDLETLISGQEFDIDHIFPQSRIKDNSLDNRVVVKNTLNREKTNDYPIKADIRQKMRPFWSMLKERGMISEKKYDRLVRSTGLTDEELSSFVARQLVETQQSTKALTVILKSVYGDRMRIVFSKAGNVSDFRHDFEMLKCREVNDLHHAKDAYLNIVVGNVYCTRFTDRFFANIHSENYSLNKVFSYNVPGAWTTEETIKTVRKVMSKNNPIITRMTREVKGQMFDLQPVTKAEAKIPRKAWMPTERYGGYTGRKAAYFIVAEHQKGRKRIRTIEPVYIYLKTLYEEDPIQYCESVLGLKDPAVITPMIRVGSLLELDGKRLTFTGGSDSQGDGRDIYNISAQLCMDYQREKYVRDLTKLLERAAAKRDDIVITERDSITREGNIDLYDWFRNKLGANVYKGLFDKELTALEAYREKFLDAPPLIQCKILKELISMLQCNATYANLTLLCGKKVGNRIRKSCNISELHSAVLIHQSVTGLFEVRENLLK